MKEKSHPFLEKAGTRETKLLIRVLGEKSRERGQFMFYKHGENICQQ